jgi:hypothetical protein
VGDISEKLSDEASLTAPIFVQIDMVGCLNPIHPEAWREAIYADLRQDVVAEIPVEGVVLREVAKIIHEIPCSSRSIILFTIPPPSLQLFSQNGVRPIF